MISNGDTEMSALTASRCSTLLFAVVVVFASAERKLITAKSGQDVTLTCRAANNNIRVVNWTRVGLVGEYVLLYQDGYPVPYHQHPSFKNRVDLQDRQMKDGDVSLILKNVTIDDAGTYECYVVQQKEGPMTLISTIYLNVVVPPGQTGEHTEDVKWIVGLLVTAGILLGVAFVIHKTCGIQNVVALFWNFVLHGRWLVRTDDNE